MKPKEIFYFVLYLVMIVSLLMTIGSRDIAEQADAELIMDMVEQLMKPPSLIALDTVTCDPKRNNVIPLPFIHAETPLERQLLTVTAKSGDARFRYSLKRDENLNWQLLVDMKTPKDTFAVSVACEGVRQLPNNLSHTTYEMILDTLKTRNVHFVHDTVNHRYYLPGLRDTTSVFIVVRSSEDKAMDEQERIGGKK
jgi:hypothetical protein